MTVQTPICDMFGIRYPIFLAGMGGVSYAEVCAAVSEAGGFGTLGMAGRSTSEIRAEMRKVRQLTKKPFGVDLLAAVPESLEKAADIIIEEGAAAFISGLGVPPRHLVDRFHAAGLKVRPEPPHLPMTHAPFSIADPRKQIPFSNLGYQQGGKYI